jgi:hypothetical protein
MSLQHRIDASWYDKAYSAIEWPEMPDIFTEQFRQLCEEADTCDAFPKGTVRFRPALEGHAMCDDEPSRAFNEVAVRDRQVIIPADGYFEAVHRAEYLVTGDLDRAKRWEDALLTVGKLEAARKLAHDVDLRMMYRYGAANDFAMLLQFGSVLARDTFRRRFGPSATLPPITPSQPFMDTTTTDASTPMITDTYVVADVAAAVAASSSSFSSFGPAVKLESGVEPSLHHRAHPIRTGIVHSEVTAAAAAAATAGATSATSISPIKQEVHNADETRRFASSRGTLDFDTAVTFVSATPNVSVADPPTLGAQLTPFYDRLRPGDDAHQFNDAFILVWVDQPSQPTTTTTTTTTPYSLSDDMFAHFSKLTTLRLDTQSELNDLFPDCVRSMARLAGGMSHHTIAIRLTRPLKRFKFDYKLGLYVCHTHTALPIADSDC